jgi:hypothetical protein
MRVGRLGSLVVVGRPVGLVRLSPAVSRLLGMFRSMIWGQRPPLDHLLRGPLSPLIGIAFKRLYLPLKHGGGEPTRFIFFFLGEPNGPTHIAPDEPAYTLYKFCLFHFSFFSSPIFRQIAPSNNLRYQIYLFLSILSTSHRTQIHPMSRCQNPSMRSGTLG